MKSLIFITLAFGLSAFASPKLDAIKVDEQKVTLDISKITQPSDAVEFAQNDFMFEPVHMVATSEQYARDAVMPTAELTFYKYKAPTIVDTLRQNHRSKYFSRNTNRPLSRIHTVLNC